MQWRAPSRQCVAGTEDLFLAALNAVAQLVLWAQHRDLGQALRGAQHQPQPCSDGCGGVDPVSWTPQHLAPLSRVARDLGIADGTLRHWVKQQDLDEGRRDDGLTTEEHEELRKLRRENRVLREEREILVKASAFFATEIGPTRSRGSSS